MMDPMATSSISNVISIIGMMVMDNSSDNYCLSRLRYKSTKVVSSIFFQMISQQIVVDY